MTGFDEAWERDPITVQEQVRMELQFAWLCLPEALQDIVHIAPGNDGYVYGGATFSFDDEVNAARAQRALETNDDDFWLGKYARLMEIRGGLDG